LPGRRPQWVEAGRVCVDSPASAAKCCRKAPGCGPGCLPVGFSGLQWAANLKVISKSEPDCKLEHRTGHRAAHCDNELSWYVISGLIVEPEKEIVPVTMPRPNRLADSGWSLSRRYINQARRRTSPCPALCQWHRDCYTEVKSGSFSAGV
jgi:hypothetical protein